VAARRSQAAGETVRLDWLQSERGGGRRGEGADHDRGRHRQRDDGRVGARGSAGRL